MEYHRNVKGLHSNHTKICISEIMNFNEWGMSGVKLCHFLKVVPFFHLLVSGDLMTTGVVQKKDFLFLAWP